ncbi:ABC transporter permease [Paracoccus siganidrum]|uniref:ABC transporter n=1 Tax=Paracoccus siganidrum TaxID=1276757 RepID=A0A419AA17_9RHOB|nr:ABC transporter [Paracoccus siganidrum]RJL19336.1 ABC transporter [Paracoccus siganidrum]RMC33116.1 ABC transporter [Paracoccus siganidrum]
MIQAAGTTLALIYHQTVYNLRTEHRNAVIGLLLTIAQTAVFIMAFLVIYLVIGVRSSPIRADFMLFIMSGIMLFMTHVQTVGAVSASHNLASGLTRHQPLNPAILIAAGALAVLYRQLVAILAILWGYHMLVNPVQIEDPIGCLLMLLLAWFSGACVGLVFLGIRPWTPKGSKLLTTVYQRVNMFASGKMFVANVLPNIMLPWFLWNPLFHIIDQARGFAFINYTPQKTDPLYALWFSLAALMIGLLINFTTRKYESLSWSAAS